MFKFKKVGAICALCAVMVGAVTIPAHAVITEYTHAPQSAKTSYGNDLWTRGLKNGNNGWYFAYSYYLNYSKNHTAYAHLSVEGKDMFAYAGSTCCAQTKSYQTTSNYYVKCWVS